MNPSQWPASKRELFCSMWAKGFMAKEIAERLNDVIGTVDVYALAGRWGLKKRDKSILRSRSVGGASLYWGPDNERLFSYLSANLRLEEIAGRLGRTYDAVRSQVVKMGWTDLSIDRRETRAKRAANLQARAARTVRKERQIARALEREAARLKRTQARSAERVSRQATLAAKDDAAAKRAALAMLGLPKPEAVPIPRSEQMAAIAAVRRATRIIRRDQLREDIEQEMILATLSGWLAVEQVKEAVPIFFRRLTAKTLAVDKIMRSVHEPAEGGEDSYGAELVDTLTEANSLWK